MYGDHVVRGHATPREYSTVPRYRAAPRRSRAKALVDLAANGNPEEILGDILDPIECGEVLRTPSGRLISI